MPQVIEGEHAIEKHQHAVGNVEVIGSVLSDVLQPPHNVIRAIANRAGGERRQTFDRRWTMLLQQLFNDLEYISRAALDLFSVLRCRPPFMVISAPRDSSRRNGRTPRNV